MKAGQLKERIIQKALDDVDFRSRLLTNPHVALMEEFNVKVPAGKTLKIVENSIDTEFLVLPPSPELNDVQLGSVSGGGLRNEIGIGGNPSRSSTDGNWQDHPIFHD